MSETLEGLKKFLLRGNLVELAVAVIIGTSFATVVTEFTNLLLSVISKFGGQPDFSQVTIMDVKIGLFLNALVAFLIMATVVYFFVVTPYEKAKAKFSKPEEPATPVDSEELVVLKEIRDALANRQL